MDELYETLRHRLHVEPDRKGECWIACPECGREDEKCSFSPKGWHCFVCGGGGSLKGLAELLNVRRDEPYRAPKRPPPPPEPPRSFRWQDHAAEALESFTAHPNKVQFWQTYRPLTTRTIDRWQLGVGRLPSCRCSHRRLVYPAFDNGEIVAFRGRSFECGNRCAKWLQSAGSQVVLWGAELLTRGQFVIVCESPVDAMLAMQMHPEVVAVASTGGAGTWKEAWTKRLQDADPQHVVVWFDNDLAGCPTWETFLQLEKEWKAKHPKARKLPRANGPWVANLLLKAKLPAALYKWPKGTPAKMDLSAAYMEAT